MKNTNDKETSKSGENLHANHRERMRNKFRENKDSMPDHEILEMLLYSVITRRNTNEQAHKLIEKAGSLNGILELDEKELCEIPYITETSAFFFKLLNEFILRLKKENLDKDNSRKITRKNIGGKLHKLFMGCKTEKMIMITVDKNCNAIRTHTVAMGNDSMAAISVKSIVSIALMDKADYVFLAHNHPSGILAPSREDFDTTKTICNALDLVDIPVIEHYIVTENSYMGIFGKFKTSLDNPQLP